MATVRELEAKIEQMHTELSQRIVAVVLTVDKHWSEYQSDRLSMRQQIAEYMNGTLQTSSKPHAPRAEDAHIPGDETGRGEPWRLPLEEFINWKQGIEQNWEPNGNARVGQRLAKALRRTSGHAEGQLYINWCGKNGRAAVRAFWISRGFDSIPDGL